MMEGNFSGSEGTEAVRFSKRQFQTVVEARGSTGRDLVPNPKPVKQKRSVSAQHAGHPLQGFNARAQSSMVPAGQEAPPAARSQAVPEELKIFLQHVSPHRPKVKAQQLSPLDPLRAAQTLGTLQQAPPTVLEHRFHPLSAQLLGLRGRAPDRRPY